MIGLPIAAAASSVLVFFGLLGACIWVGGFIAIAVVARSIRKTVERPAQIAFFRSLGRSYGIVGSVALAVALGCGGALLSDRAWGALPLAAIVVAVALVLSTAVGVIQARRMTRLRRQALHQPGDAAMAARVSSGASRAWVLRSMIGLLTIALLALTAALVP